MWVQDSKAGEVYYGEDSCLYSPGHNQNWIYGDVIQLSKMAPTRRDTMLGHFSALF